MSLDEQNFIKNFILSSGSLKKVAKDYEVTYPTVRLRLDRLISKIQIHSNNQEDNYISYLKNLAIEEKISVSLVKDIIGEYKKTVGEE